MPATVLALHPDDEVHRSVMRTGLSCVGVSDSIPVHALRMLASIGAKLLVIRMLAYSV